MEERLFPTAEAAERLKNVAAWSPVLGSTPFVREFCGFLGGRLAGHEIVPVGFVMAFLLVVKDARRDKDGFTGERMPRELAGQHPMLYELIMQYQEQIARMAFGEEFGDLVGAEVRSLAE